MCRRAEYVVAFILVFHMASTGLCQDARRPLSLNKFIKIYSYFKNSRGGNLNQADHQLFANSVIDRHGVAFAPTLTVRKRLSEAGVDEPTIANVYTELARGRGVGVYVFEFDSQDAQMGKDFARRVHLEIERQKPRIQEIVDRKEFLPNATVYNDWKTKVSDLYSFYVTGTISSQNGTSTITARIRFRPAKTKNDSAVDVQPLELKGKPNQENAKTVATWFVNALLDTCTYKPEH